MNYAQQGYSDTLEALGLQKEAFFGGAGKRVGDFIQKIRGRSPAFIQERRQILDNAAQLKEHKMLNELSQRHGITQSSAPTPAATATPAPAPTAPEEPGMFSKAREWWGKRSTPVKAGLGLAVAAPIGYGLWNQGGDPSYPPPPAPIYGQRPLPY